uniref:T-complex protein 1 subunit alpha n=1 Tax=Hirondellea gigas TaxID=1518452 RepID=A0A6A7G5B4_9CRUS
MSQLPINGVRRVGQEVRDQNVMAVSAISNVVKSSLGPVGLDKMLVDEVGDVTITNDGATILKLIEVEHPAAKIMVELAILQDEEVGDGTTSVVIIAAELIKRANELVKNSIHPTTIISGYQRARKEACKFIADHMTKKVDTLGRKCLLEAAKTAMSSKIIGLDADFFAEIAVTAIERVRHVSEESKVEKKDAKGRSSVKNVNILKVHGKSQNDSRLVDGIALYQTRAAQGMPRSLKNARIALVDFDLRKTKLQFNVNVLITNPENLEAIRDRETELTKERIDLLLDAGVNVVISTKGIDDLAMKYFIDRNCIAIRRVSKRDAKRIARATGGRVLISLADIDNEGGEVIDESSIGVAESVHEERIGDEDIFFINGCQTTRSQTLILRGANDFMLDEMERSIHDALCIVKRTLESNRVVPGGGAVEVALSVHLEHVAESMGSREQLAIFEFAQALLVIPKTLATNGAYDAAELIANLRAFHNAAQTQENKKHYMWTGLDLTKGQVRDNFAAGVLEPAMSKIKSIRFATEAAITILRIDEHITMNPKVNPKNPAGDEM